MTKKIHSVTISPTRNKCDDCLPSHCCRYATQMISAPRSMRDFDHLLWQVSHRTVHVFKDADGWFLRIMSDCEHLQNDGRCGIYATRPLVCREHSNDFCERDESIEKGAEYYFQDYAQLDAYCAKRFRNWTRRFEMM